MANNEHIRDFLKYYFNIPTEPQYAVLLTGLWGSGKTWFIKDFFSNHVESPERVLYLSLYGMQSYEDIEAEIFRLIHPILGSKPARILGRLARGVLKTSLNFDLDGDGKSDGSVSVGVPPEKMLERVSLDSSHILVLDDLERCSIPIADLLGYVNQFIEHGGIKAILIANERELLANDDGYAKIKEKLIGRTFEVVPEVDSALEHFANDLPSTQSKEIIRSNFTLISQVYECSTYKNLRLVRHSLWDFDRIMQLLDPDVLRSEKLLADLLALFLSYSLEIRSGKINVSELRKLKDNWTLYLLRERSGQPNPDQHINDIFNKYSGLKLYTSLVTTEVWESIFSTGSIPADELNEALLKSKYFQDENQPNWVKLWYGINLSDDDFDVVFAQVQSEWNCRFYRKLGEVIHVVGLFVRYAKSGIYQRTVDEVVDSAKEYIDQLLASGEISIAQPNSRPSLFERESYAGLGFTSLDDDKFQAFLKYIDERRQDALNSSFPGQAIDLLNLIGNDTNLFYRRIILNNDPENVYYNTPILHLIPSGDFVARLLMSSPEDRRTVAYALKERYSFHQFCTDLLPELDWLKEIANQIKTEIEVRAGRVSSLSLSMLLDPYITQSIAQLEQAILEQKM